VSFERTFSWPVGMTRVSPGKRRDRARRRRAKASALGSFSGMPEARGAQSFIMNATSASGCCGGGLGLPFGGLFVGLFACLAIVEAALGRDSWAKSARFMGGTSKHCGPRETSHP
jgi:hypothetical protein